MRVRGSKLEARIKASGCYLTKTAHAHYRLTANPHGTAVTLRSLLWPTHANIQGQTMLLRPVSSHIAHSWIMNGTKADFEIASSWNQQHPLPIPLHREKSHNPPWAFTQRCTTPRCSGLHDQTFVYLILKALKPPPGRHVTAVRPVESNQRLALVLASGGRLAFQSSC